MSSPAYRTLLRDQYGIVSREQLLEIGWSRQRIGRLLEGGELVAVAGAVYRSAAHDVRPEALVHAMLLWLGEDGVLIGRAAAWWWQLLPEPPDILDFGGPQRRGPRPAGVQLHRVYVDTRDRASVRGVRVLTKPMAALRTAADLEGRRPGAGITFIDRTIQEGIDHNDFPGILRRHRFCTGNALGRYIADITADDSESVGERRTATLLRGAGFQGWRQQVWIEACGARYRVDFAFERERVVLEFDGFAFHSSPERFSADKRRDDDLRAAGWRVVHTTWRELHAAPDDVIRRVRRALAG